MIHLVFSTVVVYLTGLYLGGEIRKKATLKVIASGPTPALLLGWIPVIGIFAVMYSYALEVIGLRELRNLTTGRAALALVLGLVIVGVVLLLLYVSGCRIHHRPYWTPGDACGRQAMGSRCDE